jgi:argininosuccinate lyase
MREVLTDNLLATDLADLLVEQGVPFREAHGIIGRLVRVAEQRSTSIREVPAEAAAELHPGLPGVLERLGSFPESTNRRVTAGGTSSPSVIEQLRVMEQVFSTDPVDGGEDSSPRP